VPLRNVAPTDKWDYEGSLSGVVGTGSLRASRLAMSSFTSPYGRTWAQKRCEAAQVLDGEHYLLGCGTWHDVTLGFTPM
jgi:hypothetical protein